MYFQPQTQRSLDNTRQAVYIKRNTKALSRNHISRGKAIIIT